MKKKKWIIPLIIVVVVTMLVGIGLFAYINKDDKLTSEERTWINDNINNVQNIYVVKDENIFSKNGSGVFYSFLNDFSEEFGIKLNIISYDMTTSASGNNFSYTKTSSPESKIFYTDHYVLISKNNQILNDFKEIENKTIGVLNSDLEYIKNYLKEINVNYNGYESSEELFKQIGTTVDYIIVPRIKFLDNILANNLEIVYHFGDINCFYSFNSENDILGSILTKYFIRWEQNIAASVKKEEFNIFTKSLGIADTEIDKLLSIDYKYGFINNSPYEVIMSGNYGGIIAEYLQEFSEFSGVYFDITKYKNIDKLVNALNKDKVDVYFEFSDMINSSYKKTNHGINSSLSILTTHTNNKVINSIYGLTGETVYVENNSNLHK